MSTAINCHRSTHRPRVIRRFVESFDPELERTMPWAGTRAVVVDGPNVREIYAVAAPRLDAGSQPTVSESLQEQAERAFERLSDLLQRLDASLQDIVTLDVYIQARKDQCRLVEQLIPAFVPEGCPREVLLVNPVHPDLKVTLQAYVIRPHSGVPFHRRPVAVDPEWDVWGVELKYGGFRHYFVTGIPGAGASGNTLRAHCDRMFQRAQKALEQEGFSIQDVPRTHLYYAGPYQDLRDARHKYFDEQQVTDEQLPASTGVPAIPRYGRAVMRFYAVQSLGDVPLINRRVDPRTQSQAFDYGSLFARARWIETDVARLEVSGTASMGRNGKVVYKRKPKQQAIKTRTNVMDLVHRCGLTAEDLVRHIVYVCKPHHLDPWWDDIKACSPGGKPCGVISAVEAGVCWQDLTIEEEATAVSLRRPSNLG